MMVKLDDARYTQSFRLKTPQPIGLPRSYVKKKIEYTDQEELKRVLDGLAIFDDKYNNRCCRKVYAVREIKDYVGSQLTRYQATLYLEHCDKNLKEFMDSRGQAPPDIPDIKRLASLLLEALSYLHDVKCYSHYNINPRKVLINERGSSWELKLSGMSLTRLVKGTSGTSRQSSTSGPAGNKQAYVAPEMQMAYFAGADYDCQEDYQHAGDIFSCGVIIYEMVTGKRPFKGGDLVDKRIKPEQAVKEVEDETLSSVLAKMLNADAKKRPKATTLLQELDDTMDTSYSWQQLKLSPNLVFLQ